MSKEKTTYSCSDCGATTTKWLGQCPECHQWNTLTEQRQVSAAAIKHRFAPLAAASPVIPLHEIESVNIERTPTGLDEFDRVLGGGVVQGGVVLLAGVPGVGKSTLLLQAMDGLQRQGQKVLYVSGEESISQISDRAKRLGLRNSTILMQAEIQLQRILDSVIAHSPTVLVIDSVQTVWSDQLSAAPGSVTQVRECAAQIARVAKANGIATFLCGHVTKDDDISGPRVLQHVVDTVVLLENEAHSSFRIARSLKIDSAPLRSESSIWLRMA